MLSKWFRYSVIFILLLVFLLHFLIVNPLYFWFKKSDLIIDSKKENLIKHLTKLTKTQTERDYLNIDILNNTAEYIYDEFNLYWCNEVEYQKFLIEEKEYKNVICRFLVENTKTIVIWAHYDVDSNAHHNDRVEWKIYQWADDNASWVAWVLELARLVGDNKDGLKNTIEFVAYTLEEMPYFRSENMWSYVHAKSLVDNNIDVDYMISLEMIGFFSDEKIQKYPIRFMSRIYPENANYIAIVWKIWDISLKNIKYDMLSNSNIDVWSINSPEFIPGITYSDHKSYWDFWIKAYMITDTSYLRNPHYHKITDTMDTLDFDKMNEVIKWVYWVIINK